MKYTLALAVFLAITGCGGGSSTDQPETTQPTVTTPSNPTQGTVLEETCNGTTLVQTIADGNGGSTQQETPNSEACGYVTPPTEGTILEEFCEDTTKVIITADGQGGELRSEEEKSEECGYEPPPEEGTPLGDSYCAGTLPIDDYDPLFESINHLLPEDRLQDYADGEGGKYTDRTVHLDQSCFVQMDKPDECPTDWSAGIDSRYNWMTCDGILQKSDVSFPYQSAEEHNGRAIIDMLVVFDVNISEEERGGLTVEEFVDRQFYEANHMYISSGVFTLLRVAGIKMVDVRAGDLYRQYTAFFNGRYEFNGLDEWQKNAEADMAFLFKSKPDDAIACGVANLDATRGLDKTRGITQCFHNSTFQSTPSSRYYERANETFAHEVGHLLGAQHEWEDATSPGLFEHSFGYNIPGFDPHSDNPDYTGVYGGYGTIMSYADKATGRFSNPYLSCTLPETGQSVDFGTTGGCFCQLPKEEQPPATNNTNTLQRTRWLMSQLHELDHSIQSQNANFSLLTHAEICLF